MLGDPSACMKPRAADTWRGTLEVNVTGFLMPSGGIVGNEMTGEGLAPDEQACIKHAIETVRLARPIDNAPLSISATLRLRVPKDATARPRAVVLPPNAALAGGAPPVHVDEPGNVPTPAPPMVYAAHPGSVPTPHAPTYYAPEPSNTPTPDPPAQMP